MGILEVREVEKHFDHEPLLQNISLAINAGEIVCLLGSSGSGKTTLLRIIAGLETPEHGAIFFEGRDLRATPVHARQFGLMFQDLALFPHKNVFENIAFGLRMQNLSRVDIRARVNAMLDLVGLAGFTARDVNTLSGGEAQRIALARSLAPRPRLLMFDEPLGALDRILREQLVADLRAILKQIGTLRAALYVTHDQDEAFAIADRVAIIHAGKIAQIGAPAEMYRAPANAFVAQLPGLTNLFPARWREDGKIETVFGVFAADRKIENAVALIRPERVRVGASGIAARVEECVFRAGNYRVRVITDAGDRLIVESKDALAIAERIAIAIDAVELVPA
ncbi:MAG: ABC transporter ATP-binding protein [Chloroflexi bacterium]|nr:ABC transporter ATP-binding protein [Chloroflexota bacterium]